jgi:hypothetical protein
MARRSKQADFVSLNLRLPPELHKELVKAAGTLSSLNSEIIRRLQGNFDLDARDKESAQKVSKLLEDSDRRFREMETLFSKRLREVEKLRDEVLKEGEEIREEFSKRLEDLKARLLQNARGVSS